MALFCCWISFCGKRNVKMFTESCEEQSRIKEPTSQARAEVVAKGKASSSSSSSVVEVEPKCSAVSGRLRSRPVVLGSLGEEGKGKAEKTLKSIKLQQQLLSNVEILPNYSHSSITSATDLNADDGLDDSPIFKTSHTKGSNSSFQRRFHILYNNSFTLQRQPGKRKSAVELLEETKAFYVKSESVLDTKQELKNADHLHVRSPTVDVAMLRSPAPPIINGGGPFPFAMCLTCPPYPHQHFEHFDHYQIHQNAHNHHLTQGSLHQQQHHLTAPHGGGHHHSGGNSSGPPSVESGGTASTGSTGGGGVTAITLGRSSSKHHQHYHSLHHHHHSSHHTKSHRSSSTGSSGSRQFQENHGFSSALLIEPTLTTLKTSTMGRTRKTIPPVSLAMPKLSQNQIKKDSNSMMAALLPGMSFTLPAQSSFQKQQHHHHHHHHHHHTSHHHQFLLQQQQALASLSSSNNVALTLPTTASAATNNGSSTTSNIAATAANGLRNDGVATSVAPTLSLDKHSLVSTNGSTLAPVIMTTSTTSSAQKTSAGLNSSSNTNVKTSNLVSGLHRERNGEGDSPPPLPPKSPRITSKPARPHDFPQQLQLQVVDSSVESADIRISSTMVPPPPPRRHSQVENQAKYLRLLQDQSSNKLPHSIIDPGQSMTLPSPILPPTPPPDVVMESPMSDSGPIISPPPAFSTPVTPMIDRQNSTTSDKSGGGTVVSAVKVTTTNGGNNVGRMRSLSQSTSHYHNIVGFSSTTTTITSGGPTTKSHSQQHHYHTPLSGTVSMSAISSVSGRTNSTRNNKSIPDLSSDVSMRYSPMSRSRSNSSPMSPEESIPASSPEDDDDDDADEDPTSSSVADNGHDGDDDCSDKGQLSSISPKLIAAGVVRRNSAKYLSHHQHPPPNKKLTLIPKSVTENFLYKVSSTTAATTGHAENEVVKPSNVATKNEIYQQTNRLRGTAEAPSPARRPILRSKSDLSHRYEKAEKSATLTSGFTLVHVDLSLPPPLPMHNSVSTNDFTTKTTTSTTTAGTGGNVKSYHHHIYQTPNTPVNTVTTSSHYHEPQNPHPHEKRATKSASDLERFFDMLGLDNTATPAPIPLTEIKDSARAKRGSESPVFFSSVSSVDSAPRRSGSVDSEDSPLDDKHGSRTVGGYGKFGPAGGPSILIQHGEPSIVERNARVIKWLFNCRKALERR